MTKILVVDDEPDMEALIRQKFRKQIREQEFSFIFASNGREGLEKLEVESDTDIVLSDINMPEMDGLTLLSKIQEHHSLLKTVIVSAYGDMENIRTAMNRGAFDFITKPVNFEDLSITMDKTIKQVAQMKDTIKAIKENNILRMYVDETVLNFMGSREFENSIIANETIEATVVFIDICSFTSISERETPDVVINLLNSYFDVMVKEIIAQGGYVDKFIGDAIMATFRGDFHLDRAVEASIAVQHKIKELPMMKGNIEFKPQVSIGINSGEMISGNIGSLSLKRLDYTTIGDAVNVAQRLQSIAEPGEIVISDATHEKIKNSFKCILIGPESLKHKSEPINVYKVVE